MLFEIRKSIRILYKALIRLLQKVSETITEIGFIFQRETGSEIIFLQRPLQVSIPYF